MKNALTLLCLLGFYAAHGQYRNPKISKMKGREVVCPASEEEHHSFVDFPSAKKKINESNYKLSATATAGSTIEVSYDGFSDEARNAFQRAVDIWSQLLTSNVKIKIQAHYQKLGKDVLGSAKTTDFVQNFPGAPELNTFYPIALAEKLADRELNSASDFEITCRFNNGLDWYFGTLPTVPQGQYDFTTVVLHELGHGMGFISTMGVDESGGEQDGFYGLGGNQAIFDKHVVNNKDQYLADTLVFKNPSDKLYRELISEALYFDSPLTHAVENNKVKLYAPKKFDDASSISHLDEALYQAGGVNSLMTPFARKGEKILNPGPIVLNMFYDMGWVSTSILHEPIKNMIQRPANISVVASIRTDQSLSTDTFTIHYLFNDGVGGFQEQAAQMILDPATSQYKTTMPIAAGVNLIDYYFSMKTGNGATITAPGSGGFKPTNAVYSFTIGKPDGKAPVVDHRYNDFVLKANNNVNIPIYVTALDDYSENIDRVYLEYKINNGPLRVLNLNPYNSSYDNTKYDFGYFDNRIAYLDTNSFTEALPGDVIRYQIKARDANGNVRTIPQQYVGDQDANKNVKPDNGFYEILYAGYNGTKLNFYEQDFNANVSDFDLLGFNISQPGGFASKGLHSTHPYFNGVGISDSNGLESSIRGYTRNEYAVLKSSIGISLASPTITFDEVVLVEPGDSASKFNDDNFFDYVVVEGTLDGNFWFPLNDGYDSRSNSTWSVAYENGLVAGAINSKTAGTSSLSSKRTINFFDSGKFVGISDGSPMLIRFRLYSDEVGYGWGWAIDNLYIQIEGKEETQILSKDAELPSIRLYPNPSTDYIKIETPISAPQTVTVNVFSLHGKEYANYQIPVSGKTFKHDLNVKYLPVGGYVLKIRESKGEVVKRFTVIR